MKNFHYLIASEDCVLYANLIYPIFSARKKETFSSLSQVDWSMRRNERHRSSSFRTSSSGTNKMEYEISESMEKQLSASAESVKVIPVPSCNPTTATTYTSTTTTILFLQFFIGAVALSPIMISKQAIHWEPRLYILYMFFCIQLSLDLILHSHHFYTHTCAFSVVIVVLL